MAISLNKNININVPLEQQRYVSLSGNDTTGTGSELNPFLTLKAAYASITDASDSKRYIIYFGPGGFGEDSTFELRSFIALVGSGSTDIGNGSTFLGRIDNTPMVWNPVNPFETFQAQNLFFFSGFEAVSQTFTAFNTVLMKDVWFGGNSVLIQGGLTFFSGGCMSLDMENCNTIDEGPLTLNGVIGTLLECTLLKVIATDIVTDGNNSGAFVQMIECRHVEIDVTGTCNVTRSYCNHVGGFPPYKLTGAGASVNVGIEEGLGTDQIFANFQGDFTASSDVMTTTDTDFLVGFAVSNQYLPANTTVISDLGSNQWQLSNQATGTATGVWSKKIRAKFLSGALPSNFVRDAKAFNEMRYIPRDSGNWSAPVPSFPSDALDVLAEVGVAGNTASNLGAGEVVFAQKVGVDLQFKTLLPGARTTLAPTSNDITITVDAPLDNTRYISADGDDTTGTGTQLNPFKTLKQAYASITDASDSNRYIIYIGPGGFGEDSTFELRSFIKLVGSGSIDAGDGSTFLGRSDNSPMPWNPVNPFETFQAENLFFFSGFEAISQTFTAFNTVLLKDVWFGGNSVLIQGGLTFFAGGCMSLTMENCNTIDEGPLNLNGVIGSLRDCTFLKVIATNIVTDGINTGGDVLMTGCRHVEVDVTGCAVTRAYCNSVGGFPPYKLTGTGGSLNLGIEQGLGTNQVFANFQADFTNTSDVMTTTDTDFLVGFGVANQYLPADTIIIADLGSNQWQLSNPASATVTGEWTKKTRIVFLTGALPSDVTRDAKALNEMMYTPRDAADWDVVPSFPTDALDLLAENPFNEIKNIVAFDDVTTLNNGTVQAIMSDSDNPDSTFMVLSSTDSANDVETRATVMGSGSLTGTGTTQRTGNTYNFTGSISNGSGITGDHYTITGDGGGGSGSIFNQTGTPTSGARGDWSANAKTVFLQADDHIEADANYASANTIYAFGNNADAVISKVSSTKTALFGSADQVNTTSKYVLTGSGAVTGTGSTANTGDQYNITGLITNGSGTTGTQFCASGDVLAGNGNSGNSELATGQVPGTGTSGTLSLTVGAAVFGTRGCLNENTNYKNVVSTNSPGDYKVEQYYYGLTLLASQTNAVLTELNTPIAQVDAQMIPYSITEATTGEVRTGILKVASNGTTATVDDSNYTETASVGVTWTADVNAGNLRLLYTTTANNKSMRADVTRYRK